MLCPFSYWDIIGHSSQLAVTLLYLDTIVHSLVDCHSNMAIEHLVEFTVFSILVLRSLMHNSKNWLKKKEDGQKTTYFTGKKIEKKKRSMSES